ncbi:MAG: hypothetical protein P4L55_13795 [Syntrophobacteraceae bacterium]|nr:hypothetical protein [Syntrophobacteraceae bacterium]
MDKRISKDTATTALGWAGHERDEAFRAFVLRSIKIMPIRDPLARYER